MKTIRKTLDIIQIANSLIKIKLFKKCCPLFMSWTITDSCSLKCTYCGFGQSENGNNSVSTHKALKIIDMLHLMGVLYLQLTGGEPLLRDDIREIIEYCSIKGIHTSLNTSGNNLENHIDSIKKLDRIYFSLDGPKQVNDFIRGKGSYDITLHAIEIAKKIPVKNIMITTVLTDTNIESLRYLLEFSKKNDLRISFQPVTTFLLGTNKENPLKLSDKNLKKAMLFLINNKSFYRKNIAQTMQSLKFLYNYNDNPSIYCNSGLAFARIDVSGNIFLCDRGGHRNNISYDITDFVDSMKNSGHFFCRKCCARAKTIELNNLLALNFNTIINYFYEFICF
ncbi:radical SAM protein [Elusimicrobiota bacterium]